MNRSEMKKDGYGESAHQGWMLASSKFAWRCDFDLKHQCCLKKRSPQELMRSLRKECVTICTENAACMENGKNRLREKKGKGGEGCLLRRLIKSSIKRLPVQDAKFTDEACLARFRL